MAYPASPYSSKTKQKRGTLNDLASQMSQPLLQLNRLPPYPNQL